MSAINRIRIAASHFAEHFRHHVVPRITMRIPYEAKAVVWDQKSYSEAFHSLWWFAWRRGASFLPDQLLYDLDEWIHHRLGDEIERQDNQIDKQILAANSGESAEPGTWFEAGSDAVFAAYDEALRQWVPSDAGQ